MALHLIRARPLGNLLAVGHVSPREQAIYLSASFVLWLVPVYLFILPAPNFSLWPMPFGLWFYEAITLTIIYIFGVFYCLARCRVDPKRHFLIDFSCLYAPLSLTTLVLVWGVFHVYASLIPWWLQGQTFDSQPYVLEFVYSARSFDLMRFLAVVGAVFVTLVRIGNEMERVSKLRMSANRTT